MSAAPYPWLEGPWRGLNLSLADGRFPHAILLTGPAGIGKRELALALAARLFCQQQTACGDCPPCRWYAAGNHPDWHPLEPEQDKTTIQIDSVRALSAKLTLSSLAGGRKVAMIEPADFMTTAAANSLLKTLEEPPGDSVLVLLASRPSRLAATILSRCQQHRLRPPPTEEALAWLGGRSQRHDWEGLLRVAGGAPLAAMQLAEDGFGEHLGRLRGDVDALLVHSDDPSAVARRWLGFGPNRCLDWFQRFISDAIRLRFGLANGDVAHNFGAQGLPATLDKIKLNRLFEYLDAIQLARHRLDGPVNAGLIIETLLIPLAAGLADWTPEALT